MEKSEEFIGVRVPIVLKKKLKAKAKKKGRTLSDYIKILFHKDVKK